MGAMPDGSPGYATVKLGSAPKIISVDAALANFDSMSIKEKKKMARRLLLAGFLTMSAGETPEEALQSVTLEELRDAVKTMLTVAAERYSTGQKITPDELMKQAIEFNLDGVGIKAKGAEKQWDALNNLVKTGTPGAPKEEPFTGVKKSKVIQDQDVWSRAKARQLVRSTLQNALQRDPTDAEYEDFVAALQEHQREHPYTIRTKERYKEGELVRTNTQTTGGTDVEEFAYNYARENPTYAEWNAVGTYLPLVFQALQSTV